MSNTTPMQMRDYGRHSLLKAAMKREGVAPRDLPRIGDKLRVMASRRA